jgi:hypothetical protein
MCCRRFQQRTDSLAVAYFLVRCFCIMNDGNRAMRAPDQRRADRTEHVAENRVAPPAADHDHVRVQ